MALTGSGQQLLAAAHAWQDDVYGVLTTDWTDGERAVFAQAIRRLVAKSPDLDAL